MPERQVIVILLGCIAVASATLSERYDYFDKVDSPLRDITRVQGGSLEEIATACDSDEKCRGFNSNGWLKEAIVEPARREYVPAHRWKGGTGGLYTKKVGDPSSMSCDEAGYCTWATTKSSSTSELLQQCQEGRVNELLLPVSECVKCLAEKTCEEGECCEQHSPGTDQTLICPPGSCCVRAMRNNDKTVFAVEQRKVPARGSCGDAARDEACTPCGLVINRDGSTRDCRRGVFVPDAATPISDDIGRCRGDPENVRVADEPARTTKGRGRGWPDDLRWPDEPSCFPAGAIVELERGDIVPIDSLAIGDSVKVGRNKFSKVFMFAHRLGAVETEFIILRTASGSTLALSGGHYIYSNSELVAATTVRVGDELSLGDGGSSAVVSVDREILSGLYNPQTLDGNIVVDGILASTYTTAMEPGFAHLGLTPFRILSHFGLSFPDPESGGGVFRDMMAAVVPRGLNCVS